jgi:hypothetical protein
MASDHRGRELHAGKRTAQEYGGWSGAMSPTTGSIGLFKEIGEIGMDKMTVRRNLSTGGRTDWYVSKFNPPVEVVPEAETDIGRGKSILDSTSGDFVVTGSTRTPARAIIAAEAMNKRIDEGRDLKTGRPKK